MPQINDIRELAQQNARYVSNSPQDWMSYLDVAARLYRYSFTDTLLIHAQRPDATACAELKLWNQKMSRWVNRGAKGIALLDDTGPRTKLRYVFDIADTHLVRGGKTPLLWNLDSHEHEQAILDHLADTYGLSQTDSMYTALMELAQQLTADNLDEAMDGLVYEVKDYGVFICKRKKNTTPCAYHAVPEKMLMMVAMDQIHHLVSTMCEEEKLVKDMMRGSNLDSARSIKMKENSILFRIQEAEERRLRLYEDYKAEILDEDEYSQLKEHYIAEKQRLEHELQKQRQRALELEKRIKICDAQMERMRGILNQNEFDEELVHELIKRIYVGMDNSVEVEFKCSDPYQEVLAIMSEVQNE